MESAKERLQQIEKEFQKAINRAYDEIQEIECFEELTQEEIDLAARITFSIHNADITL